MWLYLLASNLAHPKIKCPLLMLKFSGRQLNQFYLLSRVLLPATFIFNAWSVNIRIFLHQRRIHDEFLHQSVAQWAKLLNCVYISSGNCSIWWSGVRGGPFLSLRTILLPWRWFKVRRTTLAMTSLIFFPLVIPQNQMKHVTRCKDGGAKTTWACSRM